MKRGGSASGSSSGSGWGDDVASRALAGQAAKDCTGGGEQRPRCLGDYRERRREE